MNFLDEPGRSEALSSGQSAQTGREVQYNRLLVALGELGAPEAISPYLLGEFRLVDLPEAEPLEKAGLIGQSKDPLYSEIPRFRETPLHKGSPYTFALVILHYSEGPYLGKVFPQDMERADTMYFVVFIEDDEITQRFVQIIERPRKHLLPLCELVDQSLDLLNILNRRFSYVQRAYILV